ncbi:MAG: polysaccharide deacetylase family protein [Ruminococcus sp.]|nr:polysaccharide deacetylase family protein [Ruminococcus sp.]MBR2305143.1 polysaccharide deacetylase family protein [Ruminococcus sp.]
MNKYIKIAILAAAVAGIAAAIGCAKQESGSKKADSSSKQETEKQEETLPKREYKDPSEYGKVIALTFDDGPSSTTSLVLDKLEEHGAVGTFFLIGDNITDDKADTVKRAVSLGCEIENHSKTHSYMTKMSVEDIKAEIDYTNEKIVALTGRKPEFFRPPYIDVNNEMYEAIDETFICGYGCDDYDAKVEIEERVERTLKQAKDGAIILLHDAEGNVKTVAALEKILTELEAQGYEFVTVGELFHAKGATPQEYAMYSEVTAQ